MLYLYRLSGVLLAGGVLCFLSYQWGKSQAKIQIVEKQVEVLRYEEKKREAIYAAPHADRDALLHLMRKGAF